MKQKLPLLLIIFSFLVLNFEGLQAQDLNSSITNNYISYFDKQVPRKANKEFQFIAYFINQGVTSNF